MTLKTIKCTMKMCNDYPYTSYVVIAEIRKCMNLQMLQQTQNVCTIDVFSLLHSGADLGFLERGFI